MNDEAEAIVERISVGTHSSEDLGRLIEILQRGGNPDLLRPLLQGADGLLAADGAYILSELGEAGKPLLPLALHLLRHPRQDVRYWAMNSVMCCADRDAAVKAITEAGLPSDPWDLTRQRAARFFKRGS